MIDRTEQDIMKGWASKETPIVSICCTTYNHENYISEAMDGFLMQETNFSFEVRVRDDCSADRTATIIKEYEKKYPNIIKPTYEPENQYAKGVKPMATVLKTALGKYFALCEGDDYWTDRNKLQIQIDLMEENTECHLSFHPADEIVDGQLTGHVFSNHEDKNRVFTDVEMIRGIDNVFCPTASMILRREAMSPIPEFFSRVPVGDNFMQILGSLNGGALYVAKNMSVYRRGHAGSWVSNLKNEKLRSNGEFVKAEEKFILSYTNSLSEMSEVLDRKYLGEINKKISQHLYWLSISYLKANMNDEFRKTIASSYGRYKLTTKVRKLVYYFRFSPKTVKAILKLHKSKIVRKIYYRLLNENGGRVLSKNI